MVGRPKSWLERSASCCTGCRRPESLEIAIVENVQRQDLNVIEEAKGYERLIKEFGYGHEKISKFMSKSRSHISNTLRLLSLPEDIVGLIEEGKLTAGQARPLIGMPNASEVAENIVKKKVTAREVESLAKKKKGVKNIEVIKKNTFSNKNDFFSARRSLKYKHTDYGRNISVIMIN